jgi:hypothetical protein
MEHMVGNHHGLKTRRHCLNLPAAFWFTVAIAACTTASLLAQQPGAQQPTSQNSTQQNPSTQNPKMQPPAPLPDVPFETPVSTLRNFDAMMRWKNPETPERPPSKGPLTILVLKSGRVVRGPIHADERGYRVDSGGGGMYFPFRFVKIAAADMPEAYRLMCETSTDHSFRRDIFLGRWCIENNLLPQAAEHFRNVLKVDATNAEAKDALAKLGEATPGDGSRSARDRSRQHGADFHPSESLSRLSSGAVRDYVTAVQPLLLARCGSMKCHGARAETSFRLERVRLGQGSNRAATARNLDTVLNQIDANFPSNSRLIQQGFQPHGGLVRAPFDAWAAAEQQARLRKWVLAVAPELRKLHREDASRGAVNRAAQAGEAAFKRDPNVIGASASAKATDDASQVPRTSSQPAKPAASPLDQSTESSSAATTGSSSNAVGPVSDPFDPAQFNANQQHQR